MLAATEPGRILCAAFRTLNNSHCNSSITSTTSNTSTSNNDTNKYNRLKLKASPRASWSHYMRLWKATYRGPQKTIATSLSRWQNRDRPHYVQAYVPWLHAMESRSVRVSALPVRRLEACSSDRKRSGGLQVEGTLRPSLESAAHNCRTPKGDSKRGIKPNNHLNVAFRLLLRHSDSKRCFVSDPPCRIPLLGPGGQ